MKKIAIIGKFNASGIIMVLEHGTMEDMQLQIDYYLSELSEFMDIKLVELDADYTDELTKEMSDNLQKYFN